jgi:parallel beta-helix repeat protein
MRRKALLQAIMLLILLGFTSFALRIEPVKAAGIIYIHSDGSVDPPTTPISTFDGVTYTLKATIYDSVEIDKNNIILDGGGNTLQGPATSDLGISLQGRTNVTIKNLIISGFATGIKLDSCSSIIISGNTLTKDSYGIHLTESTGNIISANNASSNSDYGIWLSSSDHNSISSNMIKSNNYDGIWISNSNNNNIDGNTLSKNNDGIRLESSSHNTVSSNKVEDSNGYDMWNTTTQGYGIILLSSSQNIVTNNIVSSSIKDGICFESSSSNTISKNTLTSNQDGIRLTTSSNNEVSDNSVTKNEEFGIKLESSSGNTIANNRATEDGRYGVSLVSSSNNTIFGNNIKNNNDGLALSSSSNNNLIGNNVTNNVNCGFKFESSSNYNRLYGNNITSNNYGIRFDSSTDNAVFQNNFISNLLQVQTSGNKEVWVDNSGTQGNYWSDYTTKYPNATEVGTSGVENATYIIDSNNQDKTPLVKSISIENSIPELLPWTLLTVICAFTVLLIFYKRRQGLVR